MRIVTIDLMLAVAKLPIFHQQKRRVAILPIEHRLVDTGSNILQSARQYRSWRTGKPARPPNHHRVRLESRAGITQRPSLFDPGVRLSPHLA
ncbi:hypothetical protein, partial [Argonema antarcticum]|uniref:hypothetical protein n=1 Tax=Argonema antarcticum TaxID=2942763 RepID=UPI0020121E9F